MEEVIVKIVAAGLRGLAESWPTVAAAFAGGQTVEESIAAAKAAAKAIPQHAGPTGTWAGEDAAQDARIRAEESEG